MATTDTFYPSGAYDPANPRSPFLRRISWGSVFAGVVVAMVVQLLLGLLGLAFGAGAVDPYESTPSVSNFTIGAGIWLVVSSLIALFLGGWTAGWLSGLPRGIGTSLHGIITWGLATFMLLFILTTAVGALISGAFSILGSGLNLVGRGASSAVTTAATGIDLNTAKNNLLAFMDLDTQAENTAGETMDATGTRRRGTVSGEVSRQTSPQALSRDTAFVAVIGRAIAAGKDSLDQSDREQLVNTLVTRDNMSHDQAVQRINSVNQKYIEGRQKFTQLKTEVGEKAKQATDVAARGVSQAATWSFIMIALGGIAAALGGYVSRPKNIVVDEEAPPSRTTRNL